MKSSFKSFLVVLLSWITEKNGVLSANNLAFDERHFCKSLKLIRKSNGKKIELCGTPALTLAHEET